MAEDLRINAALTIPGADLRWRAVRSSGPGGQNVNKVATKVELRFALAATRVLDAGTKTRLRVLAANRLDADGNLVFTSDRTRYQDRNLSDTRSRLALLILRAMIPPKPRRPTRPSRASNQRRLEQKRHSSSRKKARRRPDPD